MSKFKATDFITTSFKENKIKFRVSEGEGFDDIQAGFNIKNGPATIVHFISRDDDNDVAVRVYNLVSNVSKDKTARVMEACNALNCKNRFTKFYIDDDGDVNVEYDFPMKATDESVGDMAIECFIRFMKMLDDGSYELLAKALYTDVPLD